MNNTITSRLEYEPIGALLLRYALPAVVGTMVNSLYNIVDRIFIGQGVGAMAISGLSLTFPIIMFQQAFGMLIGAGSATRVSIYLGKKEHEKAEKVVGNALILIFIISLITVIPSLLLMEELLVLFGGSEQTIPYAADYLYIVVPTSILTSLSFSFNAIMRASGYPGKAMITMLIGAVLNCVLDPLFIFVFKMGIQGAAIATVISMAASTFFVMHHFINKNTLVRLRRKYMKLDAETVWAILSIGISPFLMQLTASLVHAVMNISLQKYGGDMALGAFGIIVSFGLLLVMLVMGITQGMQPIVGFNYGAGHYGRVMQTLRLVIIASTVVMGSGWLCCLLVPEMIAGCFTQDPELIAIAANGIRLNMSMFIVVGSQIAISQFFQSIGVAWKAIFLSLTRQLVYLIPMLFIFPLFWGLDGVWYTAPFSDALAAITAWLFLFHFIKTNPNHKHGACKT